jgi:Na+-transporting NADH:ubiquinone oxidoreductase subunit A
MADIKIVKGLNIPISGQPKGDIKLLRANEHSFPLEMPKQIALDLKPFEEFKFKLLVEVGDSVKIGQPLVEDKSAHGRFFVSPAAGIVSDIRRGLKRRLLAIVIDVAEKEEYIEYPKIDPNTASKSDIIKQLLSGGIFTRIHRRPFNILANPQEHPRSIFVKAIESAPYTPPAEMQVKGQEKEFQAGLDALSKLTDGKVHLVYSVKSTCSAFIDAKNVEKHTAEGPHPIGTYSVHIQKIDPITSVEDVVWTLNAHDVVLIGHLLTNGRYYTERVISVAGPGIIEDKTGYYKVREGLPINSIIEGRLPKGSFRLISGDPLTGTHVEQNDFLGFNDFVFCAISENESREFLHFFRLGKDKYSMSRAYLSGHFNNDNRQYDFNTSLHGEPRPFIVASMYDKVQPLDISTMLLVKAVMAEDYELAETLGLLEVDSEDFALATFVCPSKVEMTDIIHQGLKQYSKEVLA